MKNELQETVKAIAAKFKPVSIFLYGSNARSDSQPRSDFEVGVLYKKAHKISRLDLKEVNQHKNIVLYPFEYENLLAGKIDTPFPESIYLRDLILGGKTLHGEKTLEGLTPPKIATLDLLQSIQFDIGIALAAVLSKRNGDETTAAVEFHKSCLFGVRCLLILEKKEFPLTYDAIFEASKKLDWGKYTGVVDHAFAVRKGEKIDEDFLYRNLSLLSKVVKARIVDSFESKGDQVLLA